MSDLISRQDAVDEIQMLMEQSEDDEHDKTWNNAIRGAVNAVKHHTKSAQPEIIRCKDCKYRYKMACHEAEFYECSHIGLTSESGKITHVGVTDDYFCADGERRDPCSSQDS